MIAFGLILNICYADRILTIYYCDFDQGKIGYYDLPCDYVLKHKIHNLNEYKLINQKFLKISLANSKLTKLNDDLPLPNHLKSCNNKNYQKELDLTDKRCANARSKIQSLKQLLNSSIKDLNSTIKIKRSLNRYRRICKKNCGGDLLFNCG